jgi:hypothetical protein
MTKLMEVIEENLKVSYPVVLTGDELIEAASRTLGRAVSHQELDEAMEALAREGCVREFRVLTGETSDLGGGVRCYEPLSKRSETMESKMMVAQITFSGNAPNLDPEGAAECLRANGYHVECMPERFRRLIEVEGDDFLEVSRVTNDEHALSNHVEDLVAPFGGDVASCGEMRPGHIPFEFLHEQVDN